MKGYKKLLVPLIVMVALIVIVIIWAVFGPKTNDNSGPITEPVVSMSLYDVKSISVTNNTTGDVIAFTGDKNDDGFQFWTYTGSATDKDYELDQEKVNGYVSLLSSFMSQDMVAENPTDLAQYGLSPANFKIQITKFDGTNVNILIGNKLASGSSCYFMLEGDTKVYTVASIKYSYCSNTMIDFVSSKILDLNYESINTVEFSRTTDNFDIITKCYPVSEALGANYEIIQPINVDASNVYAHMIDGIIGLKVGKYVELSEEDIIKYKLDNPAYTFTFTLNDGKKITVQFSDVIEDDMFYGICSNSDEYFMVSTMQVTGFDAPVMSLIGDWLCYNTMTQLSQISCSYNGDEWTLELDVVDTLMNEDSKAELNMRNAKTTFPDGSRNYAAILVESVSCIEIGGVDFDCDKTIDDSVMTLTVKTNNYSTHKFDFVPRDSLSYYVFSDDEYTNFYVLSEELFGFGGYDTLHYGVWPAYELLKTSIDNQINGTYNIDDFIESYEAES